jgi:hypothetical protein
MSDALLRSATVYDLAPGSEVLLQGQTNLFPWSSRSSDVTARVALDLDDTIVQRLFDQLQSGQISADQLQLRSGPLPTAELSVPVTSLHGGSEGMDRDMNSALKASQFPLIIYRLEKVEDAKTIRDTRGGNLAFELGVSGALTVAGVQRTVASRLTIQRDAERHYRVYAKVAVRMTDFGVKPPTAFFGFIRALDALAVIFRLTFALRQ